jgi:hypothetical protein
MVIKTLGLTEYYRGNNTRSESVSSVKRVYVDIDGYQKMISFNYNNNDRLEVFPNYHSSFGIENEIDKNSILTIKFERKEIQFDLKPIFAISINQNEEEETRVEQERLTIYNSDSTNKYKLEIENAYFNTNKEFTNIRGRFFVGKK